MRVAASPAMVIWYDARRLRRRCSVVVASTGQYAAKQRDVGRKGRHVEGDRDQDPHEARVVELLHCLVEAHKLREHDVDPHDQQDDYQHPGDQLAAVRQQILKRAGAVDVLALVVAVFDIEVELELAIALGASHQRARGSRRWITPATLLTVGSSAGATRHSPSARARPASRSTT